MVGDAFTVVNAQGVQDLLPASDAAGEVGAVLALLGGDEAQHFHGGLLGREVPTLADRPPEPRVQTLDRIRGVDDGAELGRELQERHELAPRRSHDPIIAGYLSRQACANASNSASAAATVGAV